jgi:hypothetical protein
MHRFQTFVIREEQQLQFRFEFFNVANHLIRPLNVVLRALLSARSIHQHEYAQHPVRPEIHLQWRI